MKVAITLALGVGRLGHIAYLKMAVHIGSRCAARRDWAGLQPERGILHQVAGAGIAKRCAVMVDDC
jgi:hypothetical protein